MTFLPTVAGSETPDPQALLPSSSGNRDRPPSSLHSSTPCFLHSPWFSPSDTDSPHDLATVQASETASDCAAQDKIHQYSRDVGTHPEQSPPSAQVLHVHGISFAAALPATGLTSSQVNSTQNISTRLPRPCPTPATPCGWCFLPLVVPAKAHGVSLSSICR